MTGPEQETKQMQYDPEILIDTVFNQVKELLEYGELCRYLYTQIQTTNIACNIINKTRKFQDYIKTWNWLNPIQQIWINFKTHFCTAHHELKETGELTMKDAGFHQGNQVNRIVSHMAGITHPYPPQGCQDPTYAPTTTPIPNDSPMIAPIVQPAVAANSATNDASTVIPQLLTSMNHIQKLIV